MTRWLVAKFAYAQAAALLTLVGCQTATPTYKNLAADVDAACGGPEWRSRHALEAEVVIERANHPDMKGLMTYDVRENRLALQFPTSSGFASFGFDGHCMWIDCPSDFACSDWPTLLQWTSWVAVPYRLTDPTLRIREVKPVTMGSASYRVAEINRPAEGPGSCVLCIESVDLRPRIVRPMFTAGMTRESEEGLFAFTYEQFSRCDSVPIPTKWTIRRWNARSEVTTTAPIASITLRRLRFVEVNSLVFAAPSDESEGPRGELFVGN
jgi:hypothetical protein